MYLAQLECEVLNSSKFHISRLITMIKKHAEVVNDTLFQQDFTLGIDKNVTCIR